MSGRFSRIRVRRNRKNGETRETTDAAATGEWQPPCPPGCSGCPRRDAEQTAPPQLPRLSDSPAATSTLRPRLSGCPAATAPGSPATLRPFTVTGNLSKNNKFFLLLKFFWLYLPPESSENTNIIRNHGYTHSRTRHQTIRRTHGSRRRIALDSQRIGLRTARTQRRGQDDAHPHHQPHHGPRHGPRAARRARNRPRGCPPHRLPARGAGPLQEDEGRRAGRLLRPPEGTFAPRRRRKAQKVVRQVRHRRVVGQEDRGALEGHGSSSSRCCTNPSC